MTNQELMQINNKIKHQGDTLVQKVLGKVRLMVAQICSLGTLAYPHKMSRQVPVSRWRQNSKRMTWEYGHRTLAQLLLHWPQAGWKSSRAQPEEWWIPHLSGCKSHSFKILKSQGLQHEVLGRASTSMFALPSCFVLCKLHTILVWFHNK